MEIRLLKACAEELRAAVVRQAQIVGALTPGPKRSDLLLEPTGAAGGRSRSMPNGPPVT
jgi:hypothetical protein